MGKTYSKQDRKRNSIRYCVPIEALRLAEDIQTIEIVTELLGRLDARTINDGNNEAGVTLRRLMFILSAARNQAWDKLRNDYLSGEPIKPRQKKQTLADVWEILKASLDDKKKT